MRLPALLTMMALLLAGCSDDPAPEEDQSGADEDGSTGPAAVIEAPEWQVGDWWTYDLSGVGTVTWVVTEDAGAAWITDVDNAGLAFANVLESISTIGAMQKGNLDGQEGESNTVTWFKFPLEPGKSWPITWAGADLEATVTEVADGIASIEAVSEAGDTRTYRYDADAQWFADLAAADPNGTELFAAELQDHGDGYDGEYFRWQIEAETSGEVTPGGSRTTSLAVPAEATDIWYRFDAFCSPAGVEMDQGSWHFTFHPSEDPQSGFQSNEVCPTEVTEQGTLETVAGDWTLGAASTGGRIDYHVVVRTLETFSMASDV